MRASVVSALVLLALGGCAKDDSDFVAPAGMTPDDTSEIAVAAGTFVLDGERVVSASLANRLQQRRLAGLADDAPSADPNDLSQLELEFGASYADGTRVSTSWRPRAWASFKPLGGSADARVKPRRDGAIVAYEEAYPGVVAAFGGTSRRLKEYLRVTQPGAAPELRYTIERGPEMGRLEIGEQGELWAYDADGNALFAVLAPFVTDAQGIRVNGAWELSDEGGQTLARAALSYEGLTYPLLIDPSFDSPAWRLDSSNQPPARGGAAMTWFRRRNEAVMFGGVGAGLTYLNDVRVRYASATTTLWDPSDLSSGATKPTGRAYAAMATREADSLSNAAIFLFGGHTSSGQPVDELWKMTLSDTAATWTQVTAPSPKTATSWPRARILHGMAATDDNTLLMFGGVDVSGALLTDTWKWDGTSWTRLCDACFPAAYGFATVPGRSRQTPRDAPLVFGGYQNGTYLATTRRWTGSTWETLTIQEATTPTLDTGALSSTRDEGTVSPMGRYLGFGFWSATSKVSVGGGLQTSSAGTDTYFNDLWSWAPGDNRWLRQSSSAALGTPGSRESAAAVFFELNSAGGPLNTLSPFGLVFGGVTSATAGTVTQGTRLYRAFADTATLTIRKLPGGTQYRLRADTSFNNDTQGYFVRRVRSGGGDVWQTIPSSLGSCGSPSSPLNGVGGNDVLRCDVTIAGNESTTAFGVLLRDGALYTQPGGAAGADCANTTVAATSTTILCGLSTTFPGQASCGATGLTTDFTCPTVP